MALNNTEMPLNKIWHHAQKHVWVQIPHIVKTCKKSPGLKIPPSNKEKIQVQDINRTNKWVVVCCPIKNIWLNGLKYYCS